MKKITNKIVIVAAGMLLLSSSCKKDVLNTSPTDAVSDQAVFTTTTNALAALNGIHRSLYIQYSNQDEGGQGSVMINADMMGDDLVLPSTGNGWWNTNYQWSSHRNATGKNRYFYRFYYKIIANANLIIANIDKAEGSDIDKKSIKAEALTYRAWAHFQLVQMFGKRYAKGGVNSQMGIPLMLINTTEGQPRATVEEVYTQVLKDLDDAIANFAGTPARKFKSHFNVNVAKGIKARVALTMQNWSLAATLASEARAGFTLMSNAQYLSGFNSISNPEWMWGSMQQEDQTTYFYSFFAYMSGNFNSTNIRTAPKVINSTLYNLISATDVRKGLWDPTGTNTAFKIPPSGTRFKYMNNKFMVAGETSVGDVPYMRMAEMYLIEAEAKARQGLEAGDASQYTGAQNALFTLVKNRDASYVLSTKTGQALIDEIMIQRRVELWGEGFRYFDLKRLNQALDRAGANHNTAIAIVLNVPAGDPRWEFLIPQDEMNANKAMQQNP